jgi:hypothetical protein
MDQGSVEDESSSDDQSSDQGTPLRMLHVPTVEDINLNYTQYLELLREFGLTQEDLN